MRTDMQDLASAALNMLPQAVLVTGPAGAVLFRNAAAEALLPGGGSVCEVLGCPPGGLAIDWVSELGALGEEPMGLSWRGVALLGRGKRQFPADISFRRLPGLAESAGADPTSTGGGGGVAAVLIVIEDVSQRISTERRLAASERLAGAGRVAAQVAHELNNPLDGVMRYVGLAQRVAGEAAGPYLAAARDGLVRMAEIIRGLLEQGGGRRWGGPKMPMEKLLDEAMRTFAPRAESLGVTVVCDLADASAIPADGGVYQVFCNIIKNALDAMPQGGLLTVRTRRRDDGFVIEFADTGCGMTQQEAQRAFEPFYTTKPPGEGTGLGLPICREILSRLGGSITVAPRKEGGVEVTVTLPAGRFGRAEGGGP
jgi:signal transduction histidine kinase